MSLEYKAVGRMSLPEKLESCAEEKPKRTIDEVVEFLCEDKCWLAENISYDAFQMLVATAKWLEIAKAK